MEKDSLRTNLRKTQSLKSPIIFSIYSMESSQADTIIIIKAKIEPLLQVMYYPSLIFFLLRGKREIGRTQLWPLGVDWLNKKIEKWTLLSLGGQTKEKLLKSLILNEQE